MENISIFIIMDTYPNLPPSPPSELECEETQIQPRQPMCAQFISMAASYITPLLTTFVDGLETLQIIICHR
jgi:hypothetical protein